MAHTLSTPAGLLACVLVRAETDAANLKACDFGLSDYFKPGQQFAQLIGSAYYVVSARGTAGGWRAGRQQQQVAGVLSE